MTEFEQLAAWIEDFRVKKPSEEAIGQAKLFLLDALGCALSALAEEMVIKALEVVADLGGREQARILGTGRRTSVPNAVFVNGLLIRTLDLNDFSGKGRVTGHPSDNIAVALTIGDWQRSTGLEVLTTIVMAYELYGRLQDHLDRNAPWDHVTASGFVAPAIAGFLMNLNREQMSHALALSAVYSITPGAVRQGHLSAAKGMANASVTQSAVFHTLLAANGLTGPLQAMEGSRGLSATVFSNCRIPEILVPSDGTYRIMDSHIKAYPCIGTAQSLVAAALQVRPAVEKDLDKIEAIEVIMADLPIINAQVADSTRRHPTSREAADHSFYFLPAVALLDGELTTCQFEDCRWEDRRVNALMDRITIRIHKDLNQRAPGGFPAGIRVVMKSGDEHLAEVPYPPGHALNRLGQQGIVGKFARYNGLKHPKIDWNALVREVDAFERAPNLDDILQIVCGID